MENTQLKSILESLILVSEQPLKVNEMAQAISAYEEAVLRQATSEEAANPDDADEENPQEAEAGGQDAASQLAGFVVREAERVSRSDVTEALAELAEEYAHNPARGIVLTEVAGGWQFRTRPENALAIRQLFDIKPARLSKPSLETMAIVAYRQPITRVEIDEIRGVDSGGVLKTLLERNLVRIVGKKEEAGRPMLYGTTQEFLELFQLKSLKDLPSLKEFRDLEEEFRAKEAAEGVIVENEPAEETLAEAIAEISQGKSLLQALDAEEEEMIGELESSLKELRQVEQDIFPKEKAEGEA